MALVDYLGELEALRRQGNRRAAPAAIALRGMIDRGAAAGQALLNYEAGDLRIALPFDDVLSLIDGLEAFVEAYFDDLDFPAELFTDVRTAQHHLCELTTLRQAFAAQATLTAGLTSDTVVLDGRPLVPHQIRQGETLESITLRYLGDLSRSWQIVELNDLVYPYLDTRRTLRPPGFSEAGFSTAGFRTRPSPDRSGVPDGVKVTGDILLLPSDATTTEPVQVGTELDVELYGRDIMLADGVIQFTADGEFQTVEGQDNMVQAIDLATTTPRGALVLHPDYGIDRFLAVGVEGTRANTVVGGMELARTIAQDPRVTGIRDLNLLFRDTINHVSMTVQLIGPGQRTLPINQVVPGVLRS